MARKQSCKKIEEVKLEVNVQFYVEEFLAWRKLMKTMSSEMQNEIIIDKEIDFQQFYKADNHNDIQDGAICDCAVFCYFKGNY